MRPNETPSPNCPCNVPTLTCTGALNTQMSIQSFIFLINKTNTWPPLLPGYQGPPACPCRPASPCSPQGPWRSSVKFCSVSELGMYAHGPAADEEEGPLRLLHASRPVSAHGLGSALDTGLVDTGTLEAGCLASGCRSKLLSHQWLLLLLLDSSLPRLD